MFRIEVMVDDKKLSYVLWALSGHCISVSTPAPVVNAAIKNGKVGAETPGRSIDLFAAFLRHEKLKEVTPTQIREWSETVGLSKNSYSNVLNNALKQGLLKRRVRKGMKGNGRFYYIVETA